MTPSGSHLVVLPSYNTGAKLRAVVEEVLACWQPVLVVVDGSTDGSDEEVRRMSGQGGAVSIVTLPRNRGKGGAALAGAEWASARGFSHVLVMDADGQHPAGSVRAFMDASSRFPEFMILGRPDFPPNMPLERRYGRRISVALVRAEVLGSGIPDPLFGFRVYPVGPLLDVFRRRRSGRRYDFDTEAAVRLFWSGTPPLAVPAPVRYFSPGEGGVSHFHYGRDNLRLARLHVRLLTELVLWRWYPVSRLRRHWSGRGAAPGVIPGSAGCGPPK